MLLFQYHSTLLKCSSCFYVIISTCMFFYSHLMGYCDLKIQGSTRHFVSSPRSFKTIMSPTTRDPVSASSTDYSIRIYHMFVDRIGKSFPRVAVWHHKALLSDGKQRPKGQFCLSFPQTQVGFFFLHTFGCQHLNKFSHLKYSAFMPTILKKLTSF